MRKKERKKKGRERKKKLATPSTISRSATGGSCVGYGVRCTQAMKQA